MLFWWCCEVYGSKTLSECSLVYTYRLFSSEAVVSTRHGVGRVIEGVMSLPLLN